MVPQQQKQQYKQSGFKNIKIRSVLTLPLRNSPTLIQKNVFKIHTQKSIFNNQQEQPILALNLDDDEASQSDSEENDYQFKEKKQQPVSSKNVKLLKYLKTPKRIQNSAVSVDYRANQFQQAPFAGIHNLKLSNNKILAFHSVLKPKSKDSPIDSYFNKFSIINQQANQSQSRFLPKKNIKLNYFGSSQDFSLNATKYKTNLNYKTSSQLKLPKIKISNSKFL